MPKPDVKFFDEALPRLKTGWDTIAEVLALTLGPRTGHVISTPEARPNNTERLTDAATIARRIIEIPGRVENVGAMMVRHMAWRMHEETGDGAATVAVLARAILEEGYRRVIAGANPMMVRQGIERATKVAQDALQEMARSIEGEEQLAQLATAMLGDRKLGRILGEMLDLLGSDGAIVIQEFMGPYLDRQYVDGLRYEKGGYASPHFITDQARREAVVEEPRVLITDVEVERVEQLVHLLNEIATGDKAPLVVISRAIKGAALATLVLNHQKKVLPCLGINYTVIFQHAETLGDMALMTGGRFLSKEVGDRLEDATLSDLGRARRVIAGRDEFTIVGGHGDREATKQRARELRARLSAGAYEPEHENGLRKRLGLLAGGVGILKFGTNSEQERKMKRQQIEGTLSVLSDAMEGGVVPGGGAAYLACIPAVRGLEGNGDQKVGIDIVAEALEAPMRQIAKNAGLHPPLVVAEAKRHGLGYGYDVLAEKVVNMEEAGIMDSVRVLSDALGIAASGGCMALTAGAIVLKRKPAQSMEP